MKQQKSVVELRFRVWVDINGERFFGPGPAELLELIGETGSISQAAKAMGMSYKKAWGIVERLNSRSRPYVVTQPGGEKGGGAELTEEGKAVVKSFQKIMDKINRIVEKEEPFLKLI